MDFKLTHFVYPIRKKICLSKHLGFYLDNPRDKNDIQEISNRLAFSRENSYFQLLASSKNDFTNLNEHLLKFKDHFQNIDPYVLDVFKGYRSEKILNFVSRLWLIVRFDDGGLREHAKKFSRKMKREGKVGFVVPEDNSPAIINEEALNNYCSLLSLLLYKNDEGTYNGQDILIKDFSQVQDDDPWFILLWFFHAYPNYTPSGLNMAQGWDWMFYPCVEEDLISNAKLLDAAFNKGLAEKLLYIGGLLNILNDIHDQKVKILLLTSILEMMLTHNPDFNRFNVEDSINKQFQLKVATVLKFVDPSVDLSEAKEKLKRIYSIRSMIAHGNFSEISKIEKVAKKAKTPDEQYPLDTVVSNLYRYTKDVVKAYVIDNKFVDFLKQG